MALRSLAPFYLLFAGRGFTSKSSSLTLLTRPSLLLRLRPVLAAVNAGWSPAQSVRGLGDLKCFSSRPTTSSLNDPSPNWSNRPPKETILLDGCDFEHWLVVVEPPEEGKTRDEIIDSYIKTLAQVVGSEEEARMKIYSVSTKHYFAFGALVSEERSYKIKELPGVRWVLPDSYLDVKNKDYGGEPFINGQAVPYDHKYHEEWVRNNARANDRSRRNDRPRNFDRSRSFERRRENMQNRDSQNRTLMPNLDLQNREGQNPVPSAGPNVQGPPLPTPPPAGGPSPNAQYMNRGASPMHNPQFQNPMPSAGPSMQGHPPPMHPPAGGPPPNAQYMNRDAPPMHNREFQNPVPLEGPNVQGPSHPMPPSADGPSPNAQYMNRGAPPMHNPSYQGAQYQNQGPCYQGNYAPPLRSSEFQNRGGQTPLSSSTPHGQGHMPPPYAQQPSQLPQGTAYQNQGPSSYQSNFVPNRDGSGISGGNAYQGDVNPYQRGGSPHQEGGFPHEGNQAGGSPGGGSPYQGAGGTFQVSGSVPQARDIPGRD